MRTIKIISLILILAIISCAFISCDQGDAGDVNLPDRPFYQITVSFQIKSDSGKTELEAIDYTYKGHGEPDILNVLKSYLAIKADYSCKIENDTLISIGGLKADQKKGEYWGFVMGSKDADGNIVKSPFTYDLKQINSNLSDGKMADTLLENGDQFVVILIKSED